jgi:hypothetical protein
LVPEPEATRTSVHIPSGQGKTYNGFHSQLLRPLSPPNCEASWEEIIEKSFVAWISPGKTG